MNVEPVITNDSFQPHAWVITRLFGHSWVYGQVVKTRCKDKVIRVDRKLIIGSKQKLVLFLK